MVGRIYKGDYKTVLHTQYKSFGPQGFREEDLLCSSYCQSIVANIPRVLDPKGMTGRIYVGYH